MKKGLLLLLLVACVSMTASSQVRVRLNALGYAAVVPNLGFEFGLTKHVTFVAEGYVSPLWNQDGFRAKGWLVTPELRYYFCEKFNKHYVGIHGNYTDYTKGQMGKDNPIRKGTGYTIGATYGHQWLLNHHWSLDAFIGAGWGHFDSDLSDKNDVEIRRDEVREFIMVDRAGVTFGYRF